LLFRTTFDDDKFPHNELQANCLDALVRMGLRQKVNASTLLECAEEVQRLNGEDVMQPDDIRSRGENITQYLYENISGLQSRIRRRSLYNLLRSSEELEKLDFSENEWTMLSQ